MNTRRTVTLRVCAVLVAGLFQCASAGAGGEVVRVGLVRFYKGVGQVALSSASGIVLTDANGKQIVSGEAGAEMTLSAEGGVVTVKFGLDVYPASGLFVSATPGDPASTVRISCLRQPARDYRGAVEVRSKPWGPCW